MLRFASLLVFASLALGAAEPAVIRVSAIPDAEPSKLLTVFEPLAAYLSGATGAKVEFVPVAKYELTVEGLAARKLDLVWFGGYTSVQAVRACKGNAMRIAMREQDAQFRSVFISGAASGITTLQQLKGKTFAFGSNSSTSGHLMPRSFLLDAGIEPESFFAKFNFSGAHDKTAKLVESGAVDAGAMNILTWQRMLDKKEIDPAKVAVFWTTPPFADYCWVVRKDLGGDLPAKLQTALLALDPANAEHKQLLDAHSASRYIAAKDEQWAGIEAAARKAGMLTD
jgi:phosphonate transport system substrate-binding protein